MSEYIVNVQTQISSATFVQSQPFLDLTPAFGDGSGYNNVNIQTLDWGSLRHTSMDHSQKDAFGHMLDKELAIIQGPPGTGKTHVSVLALRTMLRQQNRSGSPIVVACQTNHALDALLIRLDGEFHNSYVRLGGQSTNSIIKERSLFDVRDEFRRAGPSNKRWGGNAQRAMEKEIRSQLNDLYQEGSLLVRDELFVKLGLLTFKQQESLTESGERWQSADPAEGDDSGPKSKTLLEKWLGNLPQPPQPHQPKDFGFGIFESDPDDELLDEMTEEQIADREAIEMLSGPYHVLKEGASFAKTKWTVQYIERALQNSNDLYNIPLSQRGAAYILLLQKAQAKILESCRGLFARYQREGTQNRNNLIMEDAQVCRCQKLIGVTVTGFAKYRALLSHLKPKIVLIEEAGELLESNQVTVCIPSVEQLILVGDHQQLGPRVQKSEHEGLKYNISLMERLVRMNHVDYRQLNVQRRMAPEISRLLDPIYGDNYQDHPSLRSEVNHMTRPDIPGMGGFNTAFIDHSFPEATDRTNSTMNKSEADLVVGFARYIVQNGMSPEQIVILTFYNGQRKAILRGIRATKYLDDKPGIRVKTVDSFQGEEADVILLSSVRNNNEKKVGFVKVENRICVALSRARRGFYMFGNEKLLKEHGGPIWEGVFNILRDCGPPRTQFCSAESSFDEPERRVHPALFLMCEKHGKEVKVKDPSYWEAHPHGGCETKCADSLGCGHACPYSCHPYAHDDIACTAACEKMLPCGHQCTLPCAQKCVCTTCAKTQQARITGSPENKKPKHFPSKPSRVVHGLSIKTATLETRNTDAGIAKAVVQEALLVEFDANAEMGPLIEFSPVRLIDFSPDQADNVAFWLETAHSPPPASHDLLGSGAETCNLPAIELPTVKAPTTGVPTVFRREETKFAKVSSNLNGSTVYVYARRSAANACQNGPPRVDGETPVAGPFPPIGASPAQQNLAAGEAIQGRQSSVADPSLSSFPLLNPAPQEPTVAGVVEDQESSTQPQDSGTVKGRKKQRSQKKKILDLR